MIKYSREHIESAVPIFKLIIIVMGVLSGMSIGGGIIAIVWNSMAATKFNVFGVTLTTGHVGIAFIALGLVTMMFVVREIIKYVHKLATVPSKSKK